MKTLIYAALIAGIFVAPVASFAQDATAPLTRADVRADLIRVEQAGYRPAAQRCALPRRNSGGGGACSNAECRGAGEHGCRRNVGWIIAGGCADGNRKYSFDLFRSLKLADLTSHRWLLLSAY
ncbi:DUF4148 domain-containing protein [Paraburkholderia nemoris]|uniref:DUF4148 domain-containing protein n=1 Tax=Paraburkholderia nemoris TaxID=2793076 RepID=UPI0038BBC4BE